MTEKISLPPPPKKQAMPVHKISSLEHLFFLKYINWHSFFSKRNIPHVIVLNLKARYEKIEIYLHRESAGRVCWCWFTGSLWSLLKRFAALDPDQEEKVEILQWILQKYPKPLMWMKCLLAKGDGSQALGETLEYLGSGLCNKLSCKMNTLIALGCLNADRVVYQLGLQK